MYHTSFFMIFWAGHIGDARSNRFWVAKVTLETALFICLFICLSHYSKSVINQEFFKHYESSIFNPKQFTSIKLVISLLNQSVYLNHSFPLTRTILKTQETLKNLKLIILRQRDIKSQVL